jgi:hypothetical protein
MVKPEPVTLAVDTVALEPPVFISDTFWLWLDPTLMLPKLTLAGLRDN